MSPTKQWLIIVFGGTTIMVITTVCGAAAGFSMLLYSDDPSRSLRELLIIDVFNFLDYEFVLTLYVFSGGVIGAVVGVPIWVWLGYMVCREKNAAPNEVIPDDSTT